MRSGRRRAGALRCAFYAVLGLAGPAAGEAGAETLRIGNTGEPETLDPHHAFDPWEERIVRDLFIGLTADAADGSVLPGLAEKWEVSDDGLVYTFTLGDHAWSDGEPVTADDVVFSFRRVLDPATAAESAPMLYVIENAQALNEGAVQGMEQLGVRAPDGRTIEITLEAPTPYFPEVLTHTAALVVPRHKVESQGDDWAVPGEMVSNGAYVAEEWSPGSRIRLRKNSEFAGAGGVAIEEVVYEPVENRTEGLQRYLAGELDVYTDLPSDQIDRLNETIPGEVRITPELGIYYLAFNVRQAPFDSQPVRQALAMAIDRAAITAAAGGVPAYSLVPPGTGNYGVPAVVPWSDQPYFERLVSAQDLLAQAGYGPGSPLQVTLRYNTSKNHAQVAAAVAGMWGQLGVDAELVESEAMAHYADLQRGNFQVARAGWIADHDDPQRFLFLLESSTGALNYAGYGNPEFDRLMQEAALTTDLEARAALLRQAEAIAMEDQPYVPIYHYVSRNLVKPYVKGWIDNVEDVHPSRFLSLER